MKRRPRSRGSRWLLAALLAVLAIRVGVAVSLWAAPFPSAFLETDYSTLHLDRAGGLLRLTLSPSGKYRLRLPLADISPLLQRGFLAFEDRHFRRHPGVNPVSILRALSLNLRHGRVKSGGSTLTMQIAKLMEPKPRTWGGKAWEILRALQLERRYTKDELLALYLNSVPLGGNIEGVGAASYLYFGKPASTLSPAEAALLIGLPKSPALFRPDRRPDAARAQRDKVLARIAPALGLSEDALAAARAAPLPTGRTANPHRAPHLLQRRTDGGGFVRRWTLDPGLQTFVEDRLRRASERIRRWGVHNGAVMVVDNRTREVLAYVGSPDFDDDRHEGQVNGARVLRSPGSLLKPFLYARGLEEGLITPRRLVFDIERRYDGYAPVNFDRHFWGPLPAEESLAMSLNIPAVQMEYELAGRGLASLLRSTRLFGDRLDRANPGLSLALGAFPMTLEELVTLYASLADGGMLRGLHFTLNDPVSPALRPILSPGAAHITVQMLARLLRPDLPQSWEFTANRGRFAYKTGTSFGLRDAWSVGVTPNHTVGVWLGNANARGSSALVGSRAAAPLLTDVMNELTRTRDVWFRSPPEVATRTVCAVSGDPVGPHCPTTLTDAFLPGRSPTAVCALHAVRFVDRRTGRDACRACRTGRPSDYVERPVLRWPPEVAAYLRRQGKPPPPLPAHNPRCPRVDATGGLAIQSPRPNGDYALTGALPGESQKLTLRVDSDRGEEDVFWFLDGVLLGRRRPDDAMAVDPTAGAHVVEVYNARGQSDRVTFRVRP